MRPSYITGVNSNTTLIRNCGVGHRTVESLIATQVVTSARSDDLPQPVWTWQRWAMEPQIADLQYAVRPVADACSSAHNTGCAPIAHCAVDPGHDAPHVRSCNSMASLPWRAVWQRQGGCTCNAHLAQSSAGTHTRNASDTKYCSGGAPAPLTRVWWSTVQFQRWSHNSAIYGFRHVRLRVAWGICTRNSLNVWLLTRDGPKPLN